MTRRRAPAVLGVVAVLAVVAALAAQAGGQRTALGVVVDVDAVSLTDVRSFTLREGDGRETTFRIGRLENEADFPPGHLAEHISTAEPVRVFYREASGERVAYRLEDASGG